MNKIDLQKQYLEISKYLTISVILQLKLTFLLIGIIFTSLLISQFAFAEVFIPHKNTLDILIMKAYIQLEAM